MVLTDRQRADLHAGIYEYLRSQNGKYWDEAADALAEADPSCVRDNTSAAVDDASVTTASTRMSRLTTASSMSRVAGLPVLERKWTAVPRLQRKVLELEKALANNAKMYANRSAAGNGGGLVPLPAGSNIERRMLPRQPQTHTLSGHAGTITCVALHPTFTIAISGSEDGTIKVWDHESGDYTKTCKGHTNSLRSLAFTPSGTHFASASSDLSIKFWDLSTYQCIRTLRGHDHTISAIKFIPLSMSAIKEGSGGEKKTNSESTSTGIDSISAGTGFLVSASRDQTIKFWDVETGFVDHTITENSDWIRTIAVRDSDGQLMASSGNDQSISIYETTGNRNKVASLVGHEHVVESLAFVTAATPSELKDKKIPDNKDLNDLLASGGRDKSVRLWKISTQECLNVFNYHENWVRSVILHPSGKYIISAGDDRSIRIMDIKSNRCLRTLDNAHPHFVTSIAMHHTLPIMVSGGVDHNMNCWQLE